MNFWSYTTIGIDVDIQLHQFDNCLLDILKSSEHVYQDSHHLLILSKRECVFLGLCSFVVKVQIVKFGHNLTLSKHLCFCILSLSLSLFREREKA